MRPCAVSTSPKIGFAPVGGADTSKTCPLNGVLALPAAGTPTPAFRIQTVPKKG